MGRKGDFPSGPEQFVEMENTGEHGCHIQTDSLLWSGAAASSTLGTRSPSANLFGYTFPSEIMLGQVAI